MARFELIQQSESMPFVFFRGPDPHVPLLIDGWVCTIFIKQYQSDSSPINRVILPVGLFWKGYLTSDETSSLAHGRWRLLGEFENASTNEKEHKEIRFNVNANWVAAM